MTLMSKLGYSLKEQVNVELPLNVPFSFELSNRIRQNLSDGWNISTSLPFPFNEKWWVRCSAQIFNEVRTIPLSLD